MDFGQNDPAIPQGMCGVFKLEITNVSYVKEKSRAGNQGFVFRFKVMEQGTKWHGTVISNRFYLGKGGSKFLTDFLKKLGLNRKEKSITGSECIGKQIWACIRKTDVVSTDGEIIDTSHSIFEFNILIPNGDRPLYMGDPSTNNGIPKGPFYKVVQEAEAIPIATEEEIEEEMEVSF